VSARTDASAPRDVIEELTTCLALARGRPGDGRPLRETIRRGSQWRDRVGFAPNFPTRTRYEV